jgi:phosphopantothenoylcysteine decarboxylase/phosphopantothenate--cysteine ligase
MHILVGVSGGIAAYKAAEVVSQLVQKDCTVDVCMTPNAERFITPLTFTALTGRVTQYQQQVQSSTQAETYAHLYPSSEVDLFIVIPATASTIARLAVGLGEDPVSNAALGLKVDCIKQICPAMNTHMWKQPSVQRNCRTLEQDGWEIVGPEAGRLACGTIGEGRLASPARILDSILQHKKKS